MCVLIMVLFSDRYESQVALCGSLSLVGSHNGGRVLTVVRGEGLGIVLWGVSCADK